MKVSVLMPAYNAESYIEEAIVSILSQTYDNWELLIGDDGSIDNTYNIATKFKDDRIKVYRFNANKKKPYVTNWLFKKSLGDLITIHDADDISCSDRFEKIVNKFKEDFSIFACGHDIERISQDGKKLNLFRRKKSDFVEIISEMETENTCGDPSLFIKRIVLEELNEIYRPYFENNMDYDLALRIIEKYRITNLTKVLSYYRNVPNSISKRVLDYKKLITQDITKRLAKERRVKGVDSLQLGNYEVLTKWENELSIPFIKDKTLHYRKMASFFMYCKMNRNAILYMFYAIRSEPMKLKNWHTLQYCIRKTLLRF